MNVPDLLQHLENVIIRRGFAGALDAIEGAAQAMRRDESESEAHDDNTAARSTKQWVRLEPHRCKHRRRRRKL